MAQRFEGKVVIVTGAASGIGAATARRFGSEGASVVLVDRDGVRLADVARETASDRVLLHIADVAVAQFYPDVTLVGNVNVQSIRLSNLFSPASTQFNIGPNISLYRDHPRAALPAR